jgi:hypothetical protein
MDKIVNYRLREFYKQDRELVQEYVNYLVYLKPLEDVGELFYMSLRIVQQVRDLMQEGTLDSLREIVKTVQNLTDNEVDNLKLDEFFGTVSSVKAQIVVIQNAEAAKLTGQSHNHKWEAVNGSERLATFGIYNMLDKLANGDILKYEQILDLVYADVFTKLYRDTVLDDINYEMSKIKTLN